MVAIALIRRTFAITVAFAFPLFLGLREAVFLRAGTAASDWGCRQAAGAVAAVSTMSGLCAIISSTSSLRHRRAAASMSGRAS